MNRFHLFFICVCLIITFILAYYFYLKNTKIQNITKYHFDYNIFENQNYSDEINFSRNNKLIKNWKDKYLKNFYMTGHVYNNENDFKFILNQSIKNNAILLIGGDLRDVGFDVIDHRLKLKSSNIIIAPGNHEIYSDLSRDNYYKIFGNYKNISFKNAEVVVLNTNTDESKFYHGGYSITQKQKSFLKSILIKSKKKPIIILTHHALWAYKLNKRLKLRMADVIKEMLNIDFKLIQFPANDINQNDWMISIHPLLVEHGNVKVFSGDGSLSSFLKYQGVDYYVSGLGASGKGNWLKNRNESYLKCAIINTKVRCSIEYLQSKDK